MKIESWENIEGGILSCYEGCGDVKSYQEFYDDNCGSNSDDYDYDYEEESSGLSDSLCDTINDLTKAGQSKIALDIVSIFFIVLWSLTMFIFPKFQCIRCLNFLFLVLAFALFIAGTASWMVKTRVDLGVCHTSVCGTDGPKLSWAITIIMFITMKFYLCIARSIYRQGLYKSLKQNHGVVGDAKVFMELHKLKIIQ